MTPIGDNFFDQKRPPANHSASELLGSPIPPNLMISEGELSDGKTTTPPWPKSKTAARLSFNVTTPTGALSSPGPRPRRPCEVQRAPSESRTMFPPDALSTTIAPAVSIVTADMSGSWSAPASSRQAITTVSKTVEEPSATSPEREVSAHAAQAPVKINAPTRLTFIA